jgi:hypothetical protein
VTLSTITALGVVVPLILGTGALGVLLARAVVHEGRGFRGHLAWASAWCFVACLIASVGLGWGLYPWVWEYHSWRPIAGLVASTEWRLHPLGPDVQPRFVVTLHGQLAVYTITDTRAAAVRVGDQLELRCVLEWREAGSPANRCEFVDVHRIGAR